MVQEIVTAASTFALGGSSLQSSGGTGMASGCSWLRRCLRLDVPRPDVVYGQPGAQEQLVGEAAVVGVLEDGGEQVLRADAVSPAVGVALALYLRKAEYALHLRRERIGVENGLDCGCHSVSGSAGWS